jgi:radical SAM superfamily enzyme YgiQ (UPF0313 family)
MTRSIKIYLTDLAHTNFAENRSLTIPLNIGFVKTHAVNHFGKTIDISLYKHPEKILAQLNGARPDIVGLANYGWNQNLNRMLGRYIREKFPNTLIVAGGPNIDPDPAQRLTFFKRHHYVDFLIIDGGEEPFVELIEWHQYSAKDYSKLPQNIVWREGDTVYDTGIRPLRKIIDNVESPYLKGHLDEFLALNMVPLIETNRGCPFGCTFCAWGTSARNMVQRFDIEQVIAELMYIAERSQAHKWIICDANFGMLSRDIEIANELRKIKDKKNDPKICQLWMSKNTNKRNLEIAEILNEMIVPVMSVQSFDSQVLKNIKRSNISTDTYVEYQQKFHVMGSKTCSDLIVPLPGATLETHTNSLRKLFDYDVDLIASHNMRLLAGAATNSLEMRDQYEFKTRYRLIHGDAGEYKTFDGEMLSCFEYEESLRKTATMSEDDLWYLRKLHFLVDSSWNNELYKPLFVCGKEYNINPLDVLEYVLEKTIVEDCKIIEFFQEFDKLSQEEWFDSEADIENYFADPKNFKRLLNQEFEKLNIMFTIILLKYYKEVFDQAILQAFRHLTRMPKNILENAARYTFAQFPALNNMTSTSEVVISKEVSRILKLPEKTLHFMSSPNRSKLRNIINDSQGKSLSKILNVQGIHLSDLRMQVQA